MRQVAETTDSDVHLFSHLAIMTRATEGTVGEILHAPTELS